VTVSNDFFRGEDEREMGFRAAMRAMDPGRNVITRRNVIYLPGSDGLDRTTRLLIGEALTMSCCCVKEP
jgi:LacI family transcriptional regulator